MRLLEASFGRMLCASCVFVMVVELIVATFFCLWGGEGGMILSEAGSMDKGGGVCEVKMLKFGWGMQPCQA